MIITIFKPFLEARPMLEISKQKIKFLGLTESPSFRTNDVLRSTCCPTEPKTTSQGCNFAGIIEAEAAALHGVTYSAVWEPIALIGLIILHPDEAGTYEQNGCITRCYIRLNIEVYTRHQLKMNDYSGSNESNDEENPHFSISISSSTSVSSP
ncbi:hypothetical protein L2E82_15109 [Cichorium intybus]|uniref:Uncharacterized protein n=1 Tax=Cichorium intybus TaxID=13427 RepID=A0ACB9F2B3_CICIN|nr:hypothetical protein L2E82_15109 [Cichorium intybus]